MRIITTVTIIVAILSFIGFGIYQLFFKNVVPTDISISPIGTLPTPDNTNTDSNIENNPLEPMKNNGSSVPTGDTFSIKTRGGDTVEVNNFYKTAKEITEEGFVLLDDTNSYSIMYFPNDIGFLVNINNKNISQGRTEFERDLLVRLGISAHTACELKISVSTTIHVNENLAGKELGLSFCPTGSPL